jgi:hypothetical protein
MINVIIKAFIFIKMYPYSSRINSNSLENQFIYPSPMGSKLIFFAPLGVGVNEKNQ